MKSSCLFQIFGGLGYSLELNLSYISFLIIIDFSLHGFFFGSSTDFGWFCQLLPLEEKICWRIRWFYKANLRSSRLNNLAPVFGCCTLWRSAPHVCRVYSHPLLSREVAHFDSLDRYLDNLVLSSCFAELSAWWWASPLRTEARSLRGHPGESSLMHKWRPPPWRREKYAPAVWLKTQKDSEVYCFKQELSCHPDSAAQWGVCWVHAVGGEHRPGMFGGGCTETWIKRGMYAFSATSSDCARSFYFFNSPPFTSNGLGQVIPFSTMI